MADKTPRNGQNVTREQAEEAARRGVPTYYEGGRATNEHPRPGAYGQEDLREGRYDSLGRLIVRVITGR